jgi:hypothetical protein
MNHRLMALASVPRDVPDELADMAPEGHQLSVVGARVMLGGFVLLLVSAVLAGLGSAPWTGTLGAALVIGVGYGLRYSVRAESAVRGRELLSNMPLCLVAVVQANQILFDPEEATLAPAVILYATGPAARNEVFVQTLAATVASLRAAQTGDPELDRIAALLDDEDSSFIIRLPHSLTGGVDVRLQVTYLDPSKIPGGYLRPHTTLAALLNHDGSLYGFLPPRTYAA